ncbi:hypothetical protein H7J87_35210 [Mycolicibacterium wolinskyi]|uniref:VirB8 protein n=1 Tax=Mycolicibacterium wolinskyi TaxID=59750 RepID=A0A1X2FEQ2_9MYCO|nr:MULTISPECIES: hypothetical protein [Mycolicibacterium]MCV7290587.1 hypothetical protein [Mycolicibacterium wolinskyi]MCV7291637.1 hypothetical protein [Mycolicibacterium goodii]ORX16913.1 hypothetical protein AWC31_18865 [Mycolicibacterium wolinskyi]
MPSRKPSSPVLDTGDDIDADAASPSDMLALAEQAEAEAAEAEAVAAAARARARAIRLRNQAAAERLLKSDEDAEKDGSGSADDTVDEIAAESDDDSEDDATSTDDSASAEGTTELTESAAAELTAEEPAESKRRLPTVSRLFWKVLASCLTILAICALLAASGWMIWQHRQAEHRQQLVAEYTAAARQSVVTLMSLDFNHAQDDVKRILDNSTGEFKADFEGQAQDFVKLATGAKVVTEATANAAAVDTMTDDTATVLVAVTTRVTNTTGANQEPRPWRVAVDLVREGDQIKLSKVEFVP